MASFIVTRILTAIPTLFLISILGFFLMELPPGDALTFRVQQLEAQGHSGARQELAALQARYQLDKPVLVRYFNWLFRFVQGDFGQSFQYQRPVRELVGERLMLTVILSICSLILIWAIGIPIGVYSATHQYSLGDHFFTALAFLGLGVPSFLLALIFLVVGLRYFGRVPIGLFSPEYQAAPWSLAKFVDLLSHIWVPAAIVAVTGTAGLIRTMRGNLLDVLRVNYVQAARARGLSERKVVWKHAVRNAMHPLVMGLGLSIPYIVSGSEITGIVLNLPTTGPMYLQAMRQQDIYLGGTMLILISIMLVIGNLIADILLVLLDPRIRFD
jgi:peptide/nickel transport system permease protein